MKNVIVTGGTGFIGSWLLQELLNNGLHVTAIVRDRNKIISEIKNSENLTVL